MLIKYDFFISTQKDAGFLRISQPLTAPEVCLIPFSLCGNDIKVHRRTNRTSDSSFTPHTDGRLPSKSEVHAVTTRGPSRDHIALLRRPILPTLSSTVRVITSSRHLGLRLSLPVIRLASWYYSETSCGAVNDADQ